MQRLHQTILIVSALLGSWLGMQYVHEFGHVTGAWLTGGQVARVVLHPLTILRTDLADNSHPLLVVWAGPVLGCLLPLAAWGVAVTLHWPFSYLLRFFAGFCVVANGVYIAGGSFGGLGDAGVMLRTGAPAWWLWGFGAVTIPVGHWLWHRQAHAGAVIEDSASRRTKSSFRPPHRRSKLHPLSYESLTRPASLSVPACRRFVGAC